MTEAMMQPDEDLALRLRDVRYEVQGCYLHCLSRFEYRDRAPLREAADGSAASLSPLDAREHLIALRETINNFTTGISDDTLLADLAAWIERCAKPPFDPAPVAADLIADIERVTRERLDGLSKAEVGATCDYLGQTETTVWSWTPFAKAAYYAAMSYRDLG